MTPTWPPADAPALKRIARAQQLAEQSGSSTEILVFYAALATFQHEMLRESASVIRHDPRGGPPSVLESIDAGAVADLVPGFLDWLGRSSHAPLAAAAADLQREPAARWKAAFERYCESEGQPPDDLGDLDQFVVEALLQPFAEAAAMARWPSGQGPTSDLRPPTGGTLRCPACWGQPFAAALRERGHGAPRALVCGLCLTEWPALRIVCPACGENRFDQLGVYRAEAFGGVRLDACETCRVYLKTIDFSVDGHAIPIVDDLATLTLDLWAGEQGYRKLRPNLLRL